MSQITDAENWKINQDFLEKAQPGDMIQFIRTLYSHWAIYIGDNEVIHRWGDNDGIGQTIGVWGNVTTIFGVQFNKAKITKSKISDVLKYGGKIRINNYLDSKWKPLPVTVILEKAHNATNQEGYNVLYSNCEHFATDCRYGQASSRQVQVAVRGSIATGVFMAVVLAASAYFLRGSSKNEEEDDDEKEITIKTT
ncbi:unnamed protein product [Rotaria sp. Silwood1]|nr:unnamed protein product [Rotaria sp. Silwood1]CAF1556706.1 unnamed protein product [Rotaria sp. Silwood1]CAF3644064.1 unnamed protein product [Rotaria sp. Silwood1]CAF3700032.1 unnamed protein product [Rotaria sp. Silwood1]CAF4705824.1 unnamed protein product [Rotaria sp. Silwood1]